MTTSQEAAVDTDKLQAFMGKMVGDTLQCHYHGLRYDASGACVGACA